MTHLPQFVNDLGVILVAAGFVTLLFRWLGQPVVLGYLLVGLLVGPHVAVFPTIVEVESVRVWAEIGVIFLLFGLGLEFSFRKLAQVGGGAGVAAVTEVALMVGIGYLLGRALGWSGRDGLFLGGMLAISSTTIIVKAFEELNLKSQGFVQFVYGVLIMEDLVAILLLVLLSMMSVAGGFSGETLVFGVVKLGLFLVLWMVAGLFVIPRIMDKFTHHLKGETILILSLGLCLLMAMTAASSGFSPALGAFMMGSILAETRQGKVVEELLPPVRDLFGAIFFVSVGMLIDPRVMVDYWWQITIITVVTVVGKTVSLSFGGILGGQGLKSSIRSGMSLAQIGEFSFIIATLGQTLKVTSNFLYPVAVAVSVITTFLTPYLIKVSENFAGRVESRVPKTVKERLDRYRAMLAKRGSRGFLSLFWEAYGVKILINTALVVGIALGAKKIASGYFTKPVLKTNEIALLSALATAVLTLPFLWGAIFGPPRKSFSPPEEWSGRLRGFHFGSSMIRLFLGLILLGFIAGQFATASSLLLPTIGFLGVATMLLGRHADKIYCSLENRFLDRIGDDKTHDPRQGSVPVLWEASTVTIELAQNSELVGKRLADSKIRENFGIIIAMIKRGRKSIVSPSGEEVLMPFDQLSLIGTDSQIAEAQKVILNYHVSIGHGENDSVEGAYGLDSFFVTEGSAFAFQQIRDSRLKEVVGGVIVGVERAGKRHINPDSTFILEPNDQVWIFGNKLKLKALLEVARG
jgi:CPA2 family monovalent cation:H+ antiporter-2